MKFKKLAYVLIVTMLMAMLSSCGKKEEPVVEAIPTPESVVEEATPEPTPEPKEELAEGMVRSYLTGEVVPKEIGRRRPVAVMMNNARVATPQAGIANAGVIYEAPVEGGMTRLMSIIEDYDDLTKIGSMRSCRDYFIFYASGFDAIYVYFGQAVYALGFLELPEVNGLSGLAGYGSSVFYRTSDRKAPHNAYTSFEGIQKGIEICDYTQKYKKGFKGGYNFAKEGEAVELSSEWVADVIKPGYYVNDARFEYNEEDGLYYRFQFGDKQIDELTGEQLAFKNVLIQYSTWRNYDENGYLNIDVDAPNRGVYITNGKAIEVTWMKTEPWGPTFYYDADGNQITMNQGKTWVCIVQDTMEGRVEIGQGNPNAPIDTPSGAGTSENADEEAPSVSYEDAIGDDAIDETTTDENETQVIAPEAIAE